MGVLVEMLRGGVREIQRIQSPRGVVMSLPNSPRVPTNFAGSTNIEIIKYPASQRQNCLPRLVIYRCGYGMEMGLNADGISTTASHSHFPRSCW